MKSIGIFFGGFFAAAIIAGFLQNGQVERRELIRVTPDVYEVQCDAVDIWITPHDGPSALDADQIAEIIVLQDYCRAKDVVR